MARQRQREETERRFSREDGAEAPGARSARDAQREQDANRTERRVVRSEDPSLSPEANELLTHELREVIGKDEVVVPANAPHHSRERHADHGKASASLASNRPLLFVTFAAAVIVGGVVGLATGSYWVLVLALALHAVGTLLVTSGVIQLTTQTEHVDPDVAARLEAEGVADPDRALTELVEDYAGAQTARGVSEVVSSGHNELTGNATDDPQQAAQQQRTAMTPSSRGGETAGEGAANALPWWLVIGAGVLSLAMALIGGGEMWVLPAVIIPIALGWVLLQQWMKHAGRGSAQSDRDPGDAAGGWKRLLPVGIFTVAGVVWFMVMMNLITDYP